MALHNQLLLNARINNPIYDTQDAIDWLASLVSKIEMKIVQGPYSSYVDVPGNRGATAAVIIETSHIAFHIWDEEDPALLQFDLYTCSTLDTSLVLDELNDKFGLIDYDYLVLEREKGFNITSTKPPRYDWISKDRNYGVK
jgi:S-adenosylmethionine/arginine decarboxylase-like enzyme